MADLTPAQAAGILLMRREARRSLETFASRVPVPGSPMLEADETAAIPLIETQQAAHHRLILREFQRCAETPHGRLMILAPPGSAKSTYASVVGPAWYLGRNAGRRLILASYGADLARRHGRRTRQLLRSPEATGILECTLDPESRAAEEFSLTNGGEYMACGILGGVTGNRAHVVVVDDPIAGRQEADSERTRNTTFAAYEDDLLTRLIPGGSVVFITTRWHEDDPAGRILPADWSGESGDIMCRDGNVWRVVCLQAQCETTTDPLERTVGDMLWPEWFDAKHWAQFRLNRRTWASLYQQKPAPDDGILFRRDDMATYEKDPGGGLIIGASDYAVTPDGGDWTEHGVGRLMPDGSLYLLDWWRGQVGPEVWIERWVDLVQRHGPVRWFGESGVIRRALEATMKRRLTERQSKVTLEWLASVSDKATRAQPAIALAGMGRIWYPRAAWVPELQRQLLVFPAGSPDDGTDTLGLMVRGADTLGGKAAKTTRPKLKVSTGSKFG